MLKLKEALGFEKVRSIGAERFLEESKLLTAQREAEGRNISLASRMARAEEKVRRGESPDSMVSTDSTETLASMVYDMARGQA